MRFALAPRDLARALGVPLHATRAFPGSPRLHAALLTGAGLLVLLLAVRKARQLVDWWRRRRQSSSSSSTTAAVVAAVATGSNAGDALGSSSGFLSVLHALVLRLWGFLASFLGTGTDAAKER